MIEAPRQGMLLGRRDHEPVFRHCRTGPGEPDGFGDRIRFRWALGPAGADAPVEGTDFGRLDAEGRLAAVTGFLDRLPPG